jgi:Protein of unknown function (DUF1264)
LVFCAAGSYSCNGENTKSGAAPAGSEKTAKTAVLETGAKTLQDTTPVKQFDIYLVGFHPMKKDPAHQMEAHHYCKQVNEDFAQCSLFDGNTKDANLIGIEYIISETTFQTLPSKERKYWHPHNYEILSGQLVGPGLPAAAEKQFMKEKMNSYGKTWHVWNTEDNGKPQDSLPLGEPELAWSFNRDGEAQPELVERRDRRMGIKTGDLRTQRQDLVSQAHPQDGVDAIKGKFPGNTQPIIGVQDSSHK